MRCTDCRLVIIIIIIVIIITLKSNVELPYLG